MADVIELLPDFPGFAVKYDTAKNPFFRPIMVENLRKLKEVAAGKGLLSAIAQARPNSRADFPPTVNEMCVPQHVNFTQSGFKREVEFAMDHSQKVVGMTPS